MSPAAGLGRSRGAPARLQWALLLAALGVFLGLALPRLYEVMVAAERAHVRQVEGELRAALGIEVMRRVIDGERGSLAELAGTNPVALAPVEPPRWHGVRASSQPPPRGSWYFDRERRALVYRPWLLEASPRWRVAVRQGRGAIVPTWLGLERLESGDDGRTAANGG